MLQKTFNLPAICSSNARHVLEACKGNAGLDAAASAGKHIALKIINTMSLNTIINV